MGTTASELSSAPVTAGGRDLIDLSVIVVNYNVREFLEQALRSVYRAGDGLSMEVFVVDNASVDGSASMVRDQFPEVHLIVNAENVGFSRANNQAIRRARGRHLLILNPDTIVQEDTFTTLIAFMDAHPQAGAVGCKILHPDGSFAIESRRAFPTPAVAFYRLIGLSALFPRSRTFGRYNMTYLPEDSDAEVDALSGSCMLVRRAALFTGFESSTSRGDGADSKQIGRDSMGEVACADVASTGMVGTTGHPDPEPCLGGQSGPGVHQRIDAGAGLLDEDFFMYGEDLDWCYRIQQSGWKIYYTPATQIIHYKGESTKKGELRYVRLFYGAMLQFADKHFESRYSRLYAALLRGGILMRATASVAGKAFRRFRWPVVDFATVFASAATVASTYSLTREALPSGLFFVTVAPAYALGAAAGIAAAGGYGYRPRIRSVWVGTFVGMLVVASASFFFKEIAFSRIVILLTFPVAATAATGIRLLWARRNGSPSRSRRAVLVGRLDEATRLRQMLGRHPRPPFRLVGCVSDEPLGSSTNATPRHPEILGHPGQLRDVVRLRQIDVVVFASAALSNQAIFRFIQRLRDLPVQFRILAEGRDHVIGKASVDDLSMVNLVEAEEALVHSRSVVARRTFECAVASVGLLIHPVVTLLATVSGRHSVWRTLSQKTRLLGHVLRGTRSLIGYDADGPYVPPEEWELRPGIFAVSDAIDVTDADVDDAGAAYWFYVRNQSASLDWDIIVRSVRLRARTAS